MCVHGLRGLFCLFNIRKTHKKEPLLRIILFSLVDATGFEPAVSHPARSVLNACHWHAGLRFALPKTEIHRISWAPLRPEQRSFLDRS